MGDFGNINHKPTPEMEKCSTGLEVVEKGVEAETEEDIAAEDNAESEIAVIIQALEDRITGNPPIYYIPGNHDPKIMYL